MPGRRTIALLAAIAAAIGLAGEARAQAPAVAIADAPAVTGWIGVRLAGPPGAVVALSEGGRTIRSVTLAADGTRVVQRLAPWSCDARSRTIAAAVAGAAPAAVTVATPSCAGRWTLRAPRTARAGSPLRVTVSDRWKAGGGAPDVCLRMAGRTVGCSAVRAGRAAVLHPIRGGTAMVALTGARPVTVRVRARTRPLRVLAAGDSMIQVLDARLGDRLPGATVRSDAHVSTGITKPWMLNWPARARSTAAAQRPDATVVFLGANDGYGLPQAGSSEQTPCCTDAWIAAYATRARQMMAAYARSGAGRVYWLTLPVPRSASFAKVFAGVNAALRKAAQAYPGQVRLIDLGRVFTPGGRFRQTLRRDGRTVDVRQHDGVHLSPAGDAIAAGLVVRAMRRDGLTG